MLRYKTTHEQAFYRSLHAIEGLRKDLLREKILNMKVIDQLKNRVETLEKELESRAAEAPQASGAKSSARTKVHSPKRKKIAVLEQWVEIEVAYGVPHEYARAILETR